MLLFAEMLKEGLISIGCEVELIVPQVFFGKLKTPTCLRNVTVFWKIRRDSL
jgi:hypothetical protein